MKAYIAIIEATDKLYKAAMTELIRLLNQFDMGGRGHYIVWNALIARAIVNSCRWSNVDAVSTIASGQAYTYLLELIYDLKTESDIFRDRTGGECFDPQQDTFDLLVTDQMEMLVVNEDGEMTSERRTYGSLGDIIDEYPGIVAAICWFA